MFYMEWKRAKKKTNPYGACWCRYCYNDAASRLRSSLLLLLLEHPRVPENKWRKKRMLETNQCEMLLSFNRSAAHISSQFLVLTRLRQQHLVYVLCAATVHGHILCCWLFVSTAVFAASCFLFHSIASYRWSTVCNDVVHWCISIFHFYSHFLPLCLSTLSPSVQCVVLTFRLQPSTTVDLIFFLNGTSIILLR